MSYYRYSVRLVLLNCYFSSSITPSNESASMECFMTSARNSRFTQCLVGLVGVASGRSLTYEEKRRSERCALLPSVHPFAVD